MTTDPRLLTAERLQQIERGIEVYRASFGDGAGLPGIYTELMGHIAAQAEQLAAVRERLAEPAGPYDFGDDGGCCSAAYNGLRKDILAIIGKETA